ncbi:peptidase M23 family protein, partial [Vibrio parahaemolyticus V-223/04]
MTSLILSSRNHNLALPLITIALTIIAGVSFSHYLLTPEEQSEVI